MCKCKKCKRKSYKISKLDVFVKNLFDYFIFWTKKLVLNRYFAILLFVILLFCISFCVYLENHKIKIAFLGDSITDLGYTYSNGYVRKFIYKAVGKGLKVNVIPAGISGNTTTDMVKRINVDVVGYKPKYLFIMGGINDINRYGKDIKEVFQENMLNMVDIALDNDIKPILLTITVDREDLDSKRNTTVDEFNKYLFSLAKEKGIQIIDVNSPLKKEIARQNKNYDVVTVDGVHLNTKGNNIVADKIINDFIKEYRSNH